MLNIVRAVADPPPGYYSTLEKAKRATTPATRYILFLPQNGYIPATYPRKSHTVISRRFNGRWTPRTDSLPRKVHQ